TVRTKRTERDCQKAERRCNSNHYHIEPSRLPRPPARENFRSISMRRLGHISNCLAINLNQIISSGFGASPTLFSNHLRIIGGCGESFYYKKSFRRLRELPRRENSAQ